MDHKFVKLLCRKCHDNEYVIKQLRIDTQKEYMKTHTEEEFKVFMAQLIETNAPLSFFSDFEKITANVDAISIKLNQLNYLVGKDNMEEAVRRLWDENPKVFSVLDILIAVRASDKKKAIARSGQIQLIENFFKTPEGVIEYLEDTGLKQVLQDKHVTN